MASFNTRFADAMAQGQANFEAGRGFNRQMTATQVNAQAAQNYAQANQANTAARVAQPLAEAEITQRNANAANLNEQTKYFGRTALAGIRQSDAAADLNTSVAEQNRFAVPIGSLFSDDDNSLLSKSLSGLKNMGGGFGYKLKRGTARVPGKGSGDKVPAMLEPGEAVLNKHAANMMGRGRIAAANAKGNQMRQKDAQSKVAKLLKQMGMV